MNPIKTYQKINASNDKISFGISNMETTYLKRNGKTDEPHKHNYYTVLVIKQAKGTHKIDFNTYKMDRYQLFFVSPGQVHQVIEQEASLGFAMTFSTQFLIENAIQLSFIESLNLFHDYGQSPPLAITKSQFVKIDQFTNEIFQLFYGNSQMKELSIGAFLKLFLIECNNIQSINPVESYIDISENRIIREFKELVNLNYKAEHSTSYYANALHITPDHLNRIVKTTIGKTAKEYIQSRIIVEAKRLLFLSTLTNKEIGFNLGFSEPANFSAFFKKCTSFSPSHFKRKELSS
ncbi:AraC-like DNA-binding protein [Wenyingzhuangia heitensis]|uniref:AraC-like DNA-binding protein n=1 Tax=Wenyingzhuangia heitensis TaxID=1487859 RepID=A0ABX0UHJ8_9FLAO|nr:helix-turn-helix domain-containing protein [Wenyingzhuangia heitensis]NIJ46487.1 AraC-like DNA-binding protein [Wenyingzhuangia heitensis]